MSAARTGRQTTGPPHGDDEGVGAVRWAPRSFRAGVVGPGPACSAKRWSPRTRSHRRRGGAVRRNSTGRGALCGPQRRRRLGAGRWSARMAVGALPAARSASSRHQQQRQREKARSCPVAAPGPRGVAAAPRPGGPGPARPVRPAYPAAQPCCPLLPVAHPRGPGPGIEPRRARPGTGQPRLDRPTGRPARPRPARGQVEQGCRTTTLRWATGRARRRHGRHLEGATSRMRSAWSRTAPPAAAAKAKTSMSRCWPPGQTRPRDAVRRTWASAAPPGSCFLHAVLGVLEFAGDQNSSATGRHRGVKVLAAARPATAPPGRCGHATLHDGGGSGSLRSAQPARTTNVSSKLAGTPASQLSHRSERIG